MNWIDQDQSKLTVTKFLKVNMYFNLKTNSKQIVIFAFDLPASLDPSIIFMNWIHQ